MKKQKHHAFVQTFDHKYTNDKNNCKVKDHCHYTGKYRGTAHSIRNLQYNLPIYEIVFRNRSNYDYHFIIKNLAKEFELKLMI